MSQTMPIKTIRDTFPDQWVTAEVTAVNRADVPVAGIVLSHSPEQLTVFQVVKAHLAKHPTSRLYTFFTGDYIPEGVDIAFPLG